MQQDNEQQGPAPADDPGPPPQPPLPLLAFEDFWEYSLLIPRDPRAPAVARTTLRAVLGAHGLGELRDRAELLATELATNAVCHTVGPAILRLRWAHPVLRVSVADICAAPLPAVRQPGRDDECGRGLLMLDVLADRWGSCGLDRPAFLGTGKLVWFELSCAQLRRGAGAGRRRSDSLSHPPC